jgi:hypothetical protein
MGRHRGEEEKSEEQETDKRGKRDTSGKRGMQVHIAYLSLIHVFNSWLQGFGFDDLLFIDAHEDQHEENAVKMISLIKRQIGFDQRINR